MKAHRGAQQSMETTDPQVGRTSDRKVLQAERLMGYLRTVAKANPEQVRLATTWDDRIAAYQLVHREYLKSGLCEEQPSGLYYSRYQTLPGSLTFVLGDQEYPAATASVVSDNKDGLPCEQIFPEEIDTIRRERGKLAEIMLLAVNSDLFTERRSQALRSRNSAIVLVNLLFGIFRHLHQQQEISEAIVLVNPRHHAIYECTGWRTLASARSYPSRRGLPAVPLHMPVDQGMSIWRHLNDRASPGDGRLLTGECDVPHMLPPEENLLECHIPCSPRPVAHHEKP